MKVNKDDTKIEEFTKVGLTGRILTENEYFKVVEMNVKEACDFVKETNYLLYCVVEGKGEIKIDDESYPIKKGDFFILTSGCDSYKIKGEVELIEALSFCE